MKLRLVALIALVVGLSRLALSAEKKSITFEPVRRPSINSQTKIAAKPRTFVKKKLWSGTRRVTRRRSALRPKPTVPSLATPAASGVRLISQVPAGIVIPAAVKAQTELASTTLAKAAPPTAEPIRMQAYRQFKGSFVPPLSRAEQRRVTVAHPPIPVRTHWSVATITAEYSPRMGASGPSLAAVRDVSFGDPRFIGDQQYRVRVTFRL